MAQLICRLPWQGSFPEASSAESIGISGWLLPVRWSRTDGLQLGVSPATLLAALPGTRFSLEWQLRDSLTPSDEQQAITALRPWLRHPQTFQVEERPLLWINEPSRLSHPHFFKQRLGAGHTPPPLILGGGPEVHEALEGMYERTEQIPLQQLSSGRSNYESFLFHAHHRGCSGQRWQVPAVQPPDPQLHDNGTGTNAQEWLALAVAWADLAAPADQDGLVLLDAISKHWQSEASGCTAQSANVTPVPRSPSQERRKGEAIAANPALLIHGFHQDLLEQILAPLAASEYSATLDLYVSTPHHQLDKTEELLLRHGWPQFTLVGVENRGRDIAPFLLELLPRALAAGHPWLVKLHTKRSSQTPSGERWGRHLIESLASVPALQALHHRFTTPDAIGLVAPAGSLLPTTVCLARNQLHLRKLLDITGLDHCWFLRQQFVAGSMWAARSESLDLLQRLPLQLESFEAEAGQIDGTLAHALERLMPALVQADGTAIEALPGDASACPPFGHPWADPTTDAQPLDHPHRSRLRHQCTESTQTYDANTA